MSKFKLKKKSSSDRYEQLERPDIGKSLGAGRERLIKEREKGKHKQYSDKEWKEILSSGAVSDKAVKRGVSDNILNDPNLIRRRKISKFVKKRKKLEKKMKEEGTWTKQHERQR